MHKNCELILTNYCCKSIKDILALLIIKTCLDYIIGYNYLMQLICPAKKSNKKKNFMAPFYRWGSTALRLEPLQGGSLLFTTKFPETGTHFISLGRMKG